MSHITHSGMITLCGRPQCGQVHPCSTPLWGKRLPLSPVSPQTTRNRISGIVTRGSASMSFDTPGLHKARNRLGEYMVGVVRASVADVDAVLLVVDPVANGGA